MFVRWYKIPTPRIPQPATGGYRDWKLVLADEGNNQCVYCAVRDAVWGGYRNFHVEHYRPKKSFPELRDVIANLFYCCPVCNVFKGDDWPGDPSPALDCACYPDPCVTDYNDIFSATASGELHGANLAARYVVERLYLNRPQLILERREAALQRRLGDAIQAINEHRQRLKSSGERPVELIEKLLDVMSEIATHQNRRTKISPYEPGDIERPKRSRRDSR